MMNNCQNLLVAMTSQEYLAPVQAGEDDILLADPLIDGNYDKQYSLVFSH